MRIQLTDIVLCLDGSLSDALLVVRLGRPGPNVVCQCYNRFNLGRTVKFKFFLDNELLEKLLSVLYFIPHI